MGCVAGRRIDLDEREPCSLRGTRIRVLVVFERCAFDLGATKVGIREYRIVKIGISEVRLAEVDAGKCGTVGAGPSLPEVCVREVRLMEVCSCQGSVDEVRASEICLTKVGMLQVGGGKVGISEVL